MSNSSWLAWQMDTRGICNKHGALRLFILDADGYCPACKEAAQQSAQATGLCTCEKTVAVNHANGTCVGCGKPPRA